MQGNINNNYNLILMNYIKNKKIDIDTAITYKRIISSFSSYNSYEEIENIENDFYNKFGCSNESEKINLEIYYLKKKLIEIYESEDNYSKDKSKLLEIIIILNDIENSLKYNFSSEELENIKDIIIQYEAEYDIKIMFLTEAYDYIEKKLNVCGEDYDNKRIKR